MTDREILELLLTKVISMEEKVTSMEVKVTSLEVKVTSLEVNLTSLGKKVTSLEDRMIRIEKEQQRHGDLIEQLIKNVAATNTRLDSLETRMNRKFEAIETDIHILLDESLNQKREIYRLKNKAGAIV